MNSYESMDHRADVLIVTVTKVEGRAVLDVFREATGNESTPVLIDDRTYQDIGVINQAHVFMALSDMGAGGPGGSQEAVRKAIDALSPDAVIMVGIAFGIDEKKQAIGDILVSKQILLYDLQRVGKDAIHSRGDKVHASTLLINRMANADLTWDENVAKVIPGLILSGDKLVDNIDYRNQLVQFAQEAIGGEMEGAGLYVACRDKNVDWILVKAICDWADGNKSVEKAERQKLAAYNAARYVLHALQIAPLKRSDARLKSKLKGQEIQLEALIAQGEAAVSVVSKFAKTVEQSMPLPAVQKFPKALVDGTIQTQLMILRQGRFFAEFPATDVALALGNKLHSGELEGGSDNVRSAALAWCARILANSENREQAVKFLRLAKLLANGTEVTIAEAFLLPTVGKVDDALGILAEVNSTAARSAALMILANHRGTAASIDWLSKAQFSQQDLDADGKTALTTRFLEIGRWDTAFEYVQEFSDSDYEQSPGLLHISALAYLAHAVPEELRPEIRQGIPYELDTFPLASDESSLLARRRACELFSKSAQAARALNCLHTANTSDDYSLWLRLRDSEERTAGLGILESSMRDPQHSLRRLHFAVKFGLKLDVEAVEREIDRKTALTGGSSVDAAQGRFTLALMQKGPAAVAEYIGRHRQQLYKHLEKQFIQKIEIEMLARSGDVPKAEELLTQLIKDGLAENEQRQLRGIIAQPKDSSRQTELIEEFENSDSLNDLHRLVNFLESQGDWQHLCNFGLKLFVRTKSVLDAERLATAFDRSNRQDDLAAFLRQYPEFFEQSDLLKSLWAWSLYREGALAESAATLKCLRMKRDHLNDRFLLINLAIASGDWKSILSFAEEEWVKRGKRSANDLLRTAQLAQLVGSGRAKELAYAAVEKAADNAAIYVGAYSLATSAGWEIDNDAVQWLHTAVGLSGEDGPVQKVSLRDIVDRQPEWDRLQNDTWEKLSQGALPIFGAAHLLNRTVVDMVLVPGLANAMEPDPRRRSLVTAYSGRRPPLHIDCQVIAIDATALLTLGALGLLETLSQMFSQVVIPHSTLGWLFDEKRKVSFHQPSKIKDAHNLQQLLADGALREFSGTAPIDTDLSAEIGDELALLLAEAQFGDSTNKFVIRSSPVHRITSLMEEEADLSAYYTCLCSCMAIVDKLKQKGQLTVSEEKKARSYLKLQEKDWPHQPELPDGAILFLDELSTTYLQHTGLLGKLKAAGLEAYVAHKERVSLNTLLNYERLSEQVIAIIEAIRAFLAAGIETGKVKLAAAPVIDETDKANLLNHPTISIFRLAKSVDALIVDDRTMNHDWNIAEDGRQIAIATTLDLLDAFYAKGCISFDQLLDSRTKLRRASYVFVPITPEELQQYFSDSKVVDNRIVETAELKAVRESLLRVRMANHLQLPKEAPWIDGIMQTLLQLLKDQWASDFNEVTAVARSNWLLELYDLRGWAHRFEDGIRFDVAETAYGAQIMILILAASGMKPSARESYSKWLDSSVLNRLESENPSLYLKIMERVKDFISELREEQTSKELE
jgi:nucleoside phosphorylase